MRSGGVPWVGLLYRYLAVAATPLVAIHLRVRQVRGKELARWGWERWGYPSPPAQRPTGPVVWFHAVSVGEGAVALPIIQRCVAERPDVHVLLTMGTVAGRAYIAPSLPPSKVTLQFAPVDTPGAVGRFMDFWRPEAAVFIESELWPNLLQAARDHGTKMALVNARVSESSMGRWTHPALLPLAAHMMRHFDLILPQAPPEAGRLRRLGAAGPQLGPHGNLKYASAQAAAGRARGDRGAGRPAGGEGLRGAVGARPVWVAASTHRGEEAAAGWAHLQVAALGRAPGLLTIVAPRHPERGAEVAEELRKMGLRVAVRSRGDALGPGVDAYVADTLGELPLLYDLAEVAFVGGSLFPGGRGHNLAEAAVSGCAVLTGPHAGHFNEMARELLEIDPGSLCVVSGREGLAREVAWLLGGGAAAARRRARQAAARAAVGEAARGVVDAVWGALRDRVIPQGQDEGEGEGVLTF